MRADDVIVIGTQQLDFLDNCQCFSDLLPRRLDAKTCCGNYELGVCRESGHLKQNKRSRYGSGMYHMLEATRARM